MYAWVCILHMFGDFISISTVGNAVSLFILTLFEDLWVISNYNSGLCLYIFTGNYVNMSKKIIKYLLFF
jgi:hypothetical protein